MTKHDADMEVLYEILDLNKITGYEIEIKNKYYYVDFELNLDENSNYFSEIEVFNEDDEEIFDITDKVILELIKDKDKLEDNYYNALNKIRF